MKEPYEGYHGIPEVIETTFDNGNKLKLSFHGGKWNIVHGEATFYDGERAFMATTLACHDDFKEALHDYCERLKKPSVELASAV